MKRISAGEARQIDQLAIQEYALPGLLLMENAGRSVTEVIFRDYKPCKALIFVGKGNNGGDGLVVARHLSNRGFAVKIILLEDPAKLKADPLLNLNIVRSMKIPLFLLTDASEDEFLEYVKNADLVVDAIFGVGIHSPVSGVFENAIRAINRAGPHTGQLPQSGTDALSLKNKGNPCRPNYRFGKEMKIIGRKQVISLDVPSGLDADSGQVQGVAVRATRTVTLALPKLGLFEGDGPKHAGEIEVVDIGLPRELLVPFLNP